MTADYIFCGTYENVIHVWDLETLSPMQTLAGHAGTVYAMTYSAPATSSGKGRLFTASYDKTIRVWTLDTLQCVQTLVRHQNSVNTLAAHRGWLFSGAGA